MFETKWKPRFAGGTSGYIPHWHNNFFTGKVGVKLLQTIYVDRRINEKYQNSVVYKVYRGPQGEMWYEVYFDNIEVVSAQRFATDDEISATMSIAQEAFENQYGCGFPTECIQYTVK